MKKIHSLTLAALTFAGAAQAQSFVHEFTPSSGATMAIASNTFSSSNRLGYSYSLTDMIQLSTFVGFGYSRSGGNNYLSLSLGVGPTFNFAGAPDLRDAFFAGFTVGGDGYKNSGNSWNGVFEINAFLGKRFRLAENVTYKPSLGVSVDMANGHNSKYFIITPFAFSLHF